MQTIRPWLRIGTYCKALEHALLARAQVGALLHLAARVEPPGVVALYLPVEDGEPLARRSRVASRKTATAPGLSPGAAVVVVEMGGVEPPSRKLDRTRLQVYPIV
jgi:hypothetical protein